ncbi:Type I inositol 1,4,5-trisphosphate 5-phosphatase 2 [Hibiscus syriacus]|uniref:Type I inositol 1,4,5-trisphosphate 5-phosphatase 2 n=1 Tax=Hibiscus syriacus TaxID=106335 RepID=A0A6A3BME9_HIBSY|nr:Type I inositol 1,4,5-trisphosphate 5-phosphatase 2 [Hibiscus syriacus]
MKTRSGKRSEASSAFWPSIVMKKWLNIKPKVYDFSEDEVETETESEDDAFSVKDSRLNGDEEQNHSPLQNQDCSSQISDSPFMGQWLRHRRGKSETLHVQCMNTKDVRVTIGTWNVAGRLPCDDLQIDDWLCMEEPADIYVIGLEVVPLNAGNVLGAKDNRPIPNWEAIIRRTLNRALEPESKHRCYSAPPPCSVANVSTDETPGLPLEYLETANEVRQNLQQKRTYGFEYETGIVWPENENQQVRVFSAISDDSFVEAAVEEDDNDRAMSRSKYVRIVSKQMVGIYISVGAKEAEETCWQFESLSCWYWSYGLPGKQGNHFPAVLAMDYAFRMSSVPVKQPLGSTILKAMPMLCFVCSHLTSGHKDGAEQRRNSDVYEIIRRTRFSTVVNTDQSQTIPSHDQVFWFGDLNYHLNMSDAKVRKLVAQKRWEELLNNDQLHKKLCGGHVFDGWKEGVTDFPPTYKYEIHSDRYVSVIPKEGEKKRSPAWCDRILWSGIGIKQLCYQRAEIRLSDHRPVSSMFLVEVEVLDHRKLQRALNVSTAAVHPEIFFDENGDFEL